MADFNHREDNQNDNDANQDEDEENAENEYNPWKAWKNDAMLYDEIFPEASATATNKPEKNKVSILLTSLIHVSIQFSWGNRAREHCVKNFSLLTPITGREYIPTPSRRFHLAPFRRLHETRLQILQYPTNHQHNEP